MILLFLLIAGFGLSGAEFKKMDECTTGRRVADRQNLAGTVMGVERGLCRVKLDRDGKVTAYLHWMLHPEGASAETDDKLVPGRYSCYVGSNAAGYVIITGPGTYENVGKKGGFRVEPSRKIVFTSGPLAAYNAKLLAGPKIGMNTNGSNFYGFVCDLKK